MGTPFGSLLQSARQKKRFTIEILARLSHVSEENIWAIESNRLIPLPEEIESLIAVLDLELDLARQLRESVNIPQVDTLNATGIEVLKEEPGGMHPWAQTIFSTELSTEGPRMSALGYLSARVRPIDLTLKQYAWDGVIPEDLAAIEDLLHKRRESWLQTLTIYRCRDIYPKVWIEKYCTERIWFGKVLEPKDVINHLKAMEDELAENPNYEVGLLTDEELYFNFILQGPFVLVEGGYEVAQKAKQRIVGGMRISIPTIVDAFRLEFERLWNEIQQENKDKKRVVDWFKSQRQNLQQTFDIS